MIPIHIDHNGIERRLGYVPPSADQKLLRASATNIQTLRINAGLSPLIAPADYVEKDFVTGYPRELILDQLQEGACVGGSCAGACARQHYLRTGQIIIPSLWFIYDQINGGRDNGANIRDAQTVMLRTGAPTVDHYPKSLWVAGRIPAGALMFKEDVAVAVSTSAECATAIQMNMFPQIPVEANSVFGKFTADGEAWGGSPPSGRASNHSIYLGGMKQIRGVWKFILVNDWNLWGPFKLGWAYCDFSAVDNPAVADDGWAHADTPAPAGTVPDIPPPV